MVLIVVALDILKVIFIGDPEYWQAMYIVPIILFANFCLGIYQNLSVWYKVTNRTRFAAYISCIGAFITLVLNLSLIPDYSYLGSALATLIAYLTMALLSYIIGKRYYPIPYNTPKILFYIVLSVTLSYISFYGFRDNLLIGIMCIFVMNLVILIKEKARILKLINLIR